MNSNPCTRLGANLCFHIQNTRPHTAEKVIAITVIALSAIGAVTGFLALLACLNVNLGPLNALSLLTSNGAVALLGMSCAILSYALYFHISLCVSTDDSEGVLRRRRPIINISNLIPLPQAPVDDRIPEHPQGPTYRRGESTIIVKTQAEDLKKHPLFHLATLASLIPQDSDSVARFTMSQTTKVRFLTATFDDAPGLDGGGPSREYFALLFGGILSCNDLHFLKCRSSQLLYPSLNSEYSREIQLEAFRFMGRTLVFCCYGRSPIGNYFDLSMYGVALAFTQNELSSPYEELTFERKSELYKYHFGLRNQEIPQTVQLFEKKSWDYSDFKRVCSMIPTEERERLEGQQKMERQALREESLRTVPTVKKILRAELGKIEGSQKATELVSNKSWSEEEVKCARKIMPNRLNLLRAKLRESTCKSANELLKKKRWEKGDQEKAFEIYFFENKVDQEALRNVLRDEYILADCDSLLPPLHALGGGLHDSTNSLKTTFSRQADILEKYVPAVGCGLDVGSIFANKEEESLSYTLDKQSPVYKSLDRFFCAVQGGKEVRLELNISKYSVKKSVLKVVRYFRVHPNLPISIPEELGPCKIEQWIQNGIPGDPIVSPTEVLACMHLITHNFLEEQESLAKDYQCLEAFANKWELMRVKVDALTTWLAKSATDQEREQFTKFATGSLYLMPNSFIKVNILDGVTESLMPAHTCKMSVDLALEGDYLNLTPQDFIGSIKGLIQGEGFTTL